MTFFRVIMTTTLLSLCWSTIPTPATGQEIPSREERLRMAKEQRAKKLEEHRAKREELRARRTALENVKSERERKSRERQIRREESRYAKENKSMRKVRAQKRRINQIKNDTEAAMKAHQWRMARIQTGLKLAQNMEAKEFTERLRNLDERSKSLWKRKTLVMDEMQERATRKFKESRDTFRKNLKTPKNERTK